MQGSRAKNEESRQCHPYPGYRILHHNYNTGCPLFFFRQHHNSKCRDFTLGIDLEGCFMDYSDCYGWNYHNDTSFESIEQAQIADYYKATSLKPENQDWNSLLFTLYHSINIQRGRITIAESVKVGLKQLVLNNPVLFKLCFCELFGKFGWHVSVIL